MPTGDRQAVRPAGGGRRDPAMLGLYREHYAEFTVSTSRAAGQAARLAARLHGDQLQLHRAGLVNPAPRRGAHRKKRPRRPMPACCCTRTPAARLVDGVPPLYLVVTPTTPPPKSIRHSSSRRRAPRRDSAAWPRWWRRRACSALHTDRGSHYFHRRPPAARCRGRSRRRSAGRLRSSASSTSPPTRRRRAAAPSGSSAPCRTGCRRSYGWPGSPISRPPTAGCLGLLAEHNARFAVPAEQDGPLSSPTGPAPGAISSASRKSASS